MDEAHYELLKDIGSGLSAKHKAGSLLENTASGLTPRHMADIILSKEQEGAGFRPEMKEPLHDFIAAHGTKPFKLTPQEIMQANEATFATDLAQHGASQLEERLAMHQASGKAFMPNRTAWVSTSRANGCFTQRTMTTQPDTPP